VSVFLVVIVLVNMRLNTLFINNKAGKCAVVVECGRILVINPKNGWFSPGFDTW
jgi:hypothetical protein